MNEWGLRLGDYMHQIGHRFHRSNDGWTRFLVGYTGFCFLMMPQALIWKIHFAFFSLATLTRIRDKGAEPTIDEISSSQSITLVWPSSSTPTATQPPACTRLVTL